VSGHRGLCPRGQDLAMYPRMDLDELGPCLCPLIDAVEALVLERIAQDMEQVRWYELEMQDVDEPGQYFASIVRRGDRDG